MANNDTKFFVKYNDINSKLKHNLQNIRQYAQKLKEHADDVREEALKTSSTFFGGGEQLISVGDLNRISETLEFNESNLIEVIDLLIEIIDKENSAINETLGKLKLGSDELNEKIENLLISYNQEKQRKRTEFSQLLGIVMGVANDLIGVVEEEDDKLAEDYISNYNNLQNMIITKAGNEQIFSHFNILLNFLIKLQDGKKIGTVLDESKVKSNGNANKFLKNFKANNSTKDITEQFKLLLEKIDSKPYPSLDKDLKDELGKFMRDRLKLLFTNIKLKYKDNNSDVDFKKIIEVKDDIDELKKTFNDYYDNLSKLLKNEPLIKGRIAISEFKFKTDSYNGSFKDFKTKIKDNNINKDELNDAINYVETLIDSKDEDDGAYNSFKDENSGLFKSDGSGSSGSSGGKISSEDWENITKYLNVIKSASEDSDKNEVNITISNLFSLLFDGEPSDKIKIETGIYKCSQFDKVMNYKNKTAHSELKKKVLEFAYTMNKTLENAKTLVELLNFLNE